LYDNFVFLVIFEKNELDRWKTNPIVRSLCPTLYDDDCARDTAPGERGIEGGFFSLFESNPSRRKSVF